MPPLVLMRASHHDSRHNALCLHARAATVLASSHSLQLRWWQVLAMRQQQLQAGASLDMTLYGITSRRVGKLPSPSKDTLVTLASHLSKLILPYEVDEAATHLVGSTAKAIERRGPFQFGDGGCGSTHPVLLYSKLTRSTALSYRRVTLAELSPPAAAAGGVCCSRCSGQPQCVAWRSWHGQHSECELLNHTSFRLFDSQEAELVAGLPARSQDGRFHGRLQPAQLSSSPHAFASR